MTESNAKAQAIVSFFWDTQYLFNYNVEFSLASMKVKFLMEPIYLKRESLLLKSFQSCSKIAIKMLMIIHYIREKKANWKDFKIRIIPFIRLEIINLMLF